MAPAPKSVPRQPSDPTDPGTLPRARSTPSGRVTGSVQTSALPRASPPCPAAAFCGCGFSC